ncbi:GntR family transcriptional regulator [Pandoraea eparura]|uniref:GntR family transcriptional regulator n=1 Tax=Pandoraea eparura TaxID=2508291 RepID=A0A5E4RFK4_9BURK|nr:GntR family transcriptional regulator [Pandoraea eparura]VVD61591.1 GntR family transcriptional regulator [Pandoraea eparura]
MTKEDNPKHVAMAGRITARIQAGEWPVGSLLPSEQVLCEQLGLSRYALREVAGVLERTGIVSRQQGIGTRVISDRPASHYTQTMRDLGDLAQYAKGTTFDVLDKRFEDTSDALKAVLPSPLSGQWLRIRGIRSAGAAGEPITYADIYVRKPYAAFGVVGEQLHTPIYKLIEAAYGIRITHVEQELSAASLTGEAAHALKVANDAPGMRIVRTYYRGDEIVEVTVSLHPENRFSYRMRFELQDSLGNTAAPPGVL